MNENTYKIIDWLSDYISEEDQRDRLYRYVDSGGSENSKRERLKEFIISWFTELEDNTELEDDLELVDWSAVYDEYYIVKEELERIELDHPEKYYMTER